MSESGVQSKPFRPLRRRVVAWALLCSALLSLALTAALIAVDYQDERDNVLRQLRFAAASYNKSMANSLWELDMTAVRLQLDGLASFPMVGKAVLTTNVGQNIESDGQTARDPADPLSWKEALVSPHDAQRVIGQLHLHVEREAFNRRIKDNAMRILAGEAIKGLLFGLLIAWLIAQLVTRHLSHMALQVASLEPNALGRPLVLERGESRHHDELDQLREAFNQLNCQLGEYFASRRVL